MSNFKVLKVRLSKGGVGDFVKKHERWILICRSKN